MTMTIKSVHIKDCWPYEYIEPVKQQQRKTSWRKKAAQVKTPKGQKLLKLPVYSMNQSFCDLLNYESQSSI